MNKKRGPEESPAERSACERLCANLSRGLHAAAQPLAILRASLSSGQTGQMNTDELRELAATSAIEVERLCTLFSGLQQLVSIEGVKPNLSPTAILPLLEEVADGVNLLFKADRMLLAVKLPEACAPAFINGAKTQQALSSVLLAAHAVSRASDTVELIATAIPGAIRVEVRNQSSQAGAVNAEGRLALAIAEAAIRSQQGSFCWSERPFQVLIELLTAPVARP